ncbi:MAG: WYL domain-containing protein [Mycoplasma sp.]|nr:WYL domain-containing protein [Mycoplasma sp.]
MKKIRVGIEILTYLSASKLPKSAKEITLYLNNKFDLEKEINKRSVLEYLREISKIVFESDGLQIQDIKSIPGKDGGWIITEQARERMRRLYTSGFNTDTLNAINDSLERAEISETYYYKKDLEQAKGILYSKNNFYEHDHEHYLGNRKEIVNSELVKKIKLATKNNHYSSIVFKYKRYKIDAKKMILKPIRLIHDLDESFLVCTKPKEFKPIFINIRNIESFEELDKKFQRKFEPSFNSSINKDKSSIYDRKRQEVTIKIKDELAYQVIELWVHGCKFNINKKSNIVKVSSYEHYKLMTFLFRVIGLVEVIKADSTIIEKWNEKVENIKKI